MRRAALLACCMLLSLNARAALVHHQLSAPGGLPINVVETGNRTGEPLLLLHGFSQSYLSWQRQLEDPELQARFRIVAMDLRGHGGSGKPWDGDAYAGHEPWARDVHAVIQQLQLGRPWIVGWSFGGYVAVDFVREYGAAATRGIVLAGSHGGLLPRPAAAPPELTGDLQTLIDNSRQFMSVMAAKPLPDDVVERGRYSYVMMPDYVRRAMQGKRLDNTDVAASLEVPMLFILGAEDPSVPRAQVREQLLTKPARELCVFEGVGHSAFVEAPERFNRALIRFTESAGACNGGS